MLPEASRSIVSVSPHVTRAVIRGVGNVVHCSVGFFSTRNGVVTDASTAHVNAFRSTTHLTTRQGQAITISNSGRFVNTHGNVGTPIVFNSSIITIVNVANRQRRIRPFNVVVAGVARVLVQRGIRRVAHFSRHVVVAGLVGLLMSRRGSRSLISCLSSALSISLSVPQYVILKHYAGTSTSRAGHGTLLGTLSGHFPSNDRSVFEASTHKFYVLFTVASRINSVNRLSRRRVKMLSSLRGRVDRILKHPVDVNVKDVRASTGRC